MRISSINTYITVFFLLTAIGYSQDAKEIVRKSDELLKSKSSYAEVTMIVVKTDWSRTIAMKNWSLEPDYALIYISEPARDKGSVTLKRKKEVWNWIPTAQKIIKIPPISLISFPRYVFTINSSSS